MNSKGESGFICSFDINQARTARQEVLTILNTLEIENLEKEMKNNENLKHKNFTYKKISSIKNMCFILNHTELPASTIYKHLKDNNIHFRYVKKIVPLDVIISENPAEHLKKYLRNKEMGENGSFKICFRSRCSDKYECKENMFKTILDRYKGIKVDLSNPTVSIHVEVIRKYIGFSFVENF